MTINKQNLSYRCERCNGLKKDCPTCQGTGKEVDCIYQFIDDKKKIAFDGDTLK